MWSPLFVGLLCAAPLLTATQAQAAVTATTVARVATLTLSDGAFEQRLFIRANHRRARRGCRPLRISAALVTAAHLHSTLMSGRRDLTHQLAGEGDLAARAVAAGYVHWRMLAENLAWGQTSPGAVFRAWVASPMHRANLDNCRLRDVGFGVVESGGRPWVTADYGRRF